MGSDNIIIEYRNTFSSLSVLVEDDGRVAYAYLRDNGNIIGDVWLYNRLTAPQIPEWRLEPAQPPFLNPQEFSVSPPFSIPINKYRCTVDWRSIEANKEVADILVDGMLIARLARNAKPGWSVFAVKDGPLAKRLIEKS
ncbi:MAG TPA: hypothetical protein VHQ47_02865 [Phycisphaerae bacterium]|nr:hypothetical protein [Phycisphaerae bacterium]